MTDKELEAVKELVEWVVGELGLFEQGHYPSMDLVSFAKHILSHPDLAFRVNSIRKCADEDGCIQRYKIDKYTYLPEAIKQLEASDVKD